MVIYGVFSIFFGGCYKPKNEPPAKIELASP